jgi:ferredoxin
VTAHLTVTIDRDRCTGSGMCIFHAPRTFDIDDEDTMVVLLEDRDDPAALRAAEDTCPNRVITVTEAIEESTRQ